MRLILVLTFTVGFAFVLQSSASAQSTRNRLLDTRTSMVHPGTASFSQSFGFRERAFSGIPQSNEIDYTEAMPSVHSGTKTGMLIGAAIGLGFGFLAMRWYEHGAERSCDVGCAAVRLGGGAAIGGIIGGLIGRLVADSPREEETHRD